MNRMAWQFVRLQDVEPSPWRNGGGTTRELCAWPSVSQWDWRLSVADIEQDGPFSVYEGVERWFAVLEGAGVELRFSDATAARHPLTPRSPPFAFSGATAADCRLINGPTRDLNLMVRSAVLKSTMKRLDFSTVMKPVATTVAAFSLAGGCSLGAVGEPSSAEGVNLPAASLAWRPWLPGQPIQLTIPSGGAVWWMEMNN